MLLPLLIAAAGPVQVLGPLVGHCWRGTLPNGAVDTHCFSAAAGRVVDRHVVRQRGKPPYRGETDYSSAGRSIRFAYRNAGGPVMAGTVRAAEDGLSFEVDGAPPIRWRWRGRLAYLAEAGPDRRTVLFRRVR